MREILFRGRNCLDEEDWVYGNLEDRNGEYHITSWFIRPKSDNYLDCDCCMVDKETVGQFTGLTDKNGKKIFEGDIVKVERDLWCGENKKEREVFNGVVCYDEKHACFGINSKNYNYLTLHRFTGDFQEVIGNIHDNPELLEVQK